MKRETPINITALIVGAIAAALLLWLGYFVYNTVTFRVVSTDPAPNQVAAVSPFFKINFNKQLSGSGLKVVAQPSVVSNVDVSGGVLTLTLNGPLDVNEIYTITVSNIEATDGKKIDSLHYSFRPVNIPSTELPKAQQQVLLQNQTNYSQSIGADPLLQQLPYIAAGFEFKLDYSLQTTNGKNQITLNITAPNATAQQDALTWLRSRGFDPSNYKINYINGQP